jgi:hypothetical protein
MRDRSASAKLTGKARRTNLQSHRGRRRSGATSRGAWSVSFAGSKTALPAGPF